MEMDETMTSQYIGMGEACCLVCARGETHGHPRHEVPDWYAYTVSFRCPLKGHRDPYAGPCELFERGVPKKVCDDVDGL